jgi:hypothetical protein
MRRLAPGVAAALVGAVIRSVTLRLRRVDERIERELAGHLAARLPELRQATGRIPGRASSRHAATGAACGPGTWTAMLARLRGSA